MGTFDWTAVAPAWEKHADNPGRQGADRTKTDVLLDRVAIAPGQRVLELGAGAGDLGLRLAELVGSEGELVLTDPAAGMVDILERRTLAVPQVRVELIDATDTGLPDASFDTVLFCMGLMFTSDPALAAEEMRRVIRPGGRVGVETWAAPEHNPWLLSVGMSAMMNGVVPGPTPTAPGGVFSLGEPEALRDVLTAGGFTQVDITPVDVEFRFPDFDTYFDTVSSLAGPLAVALASAPPEQLQAVRDSAAQATERFSTPDGLVLPGRALVAVATA